MRQRDSMKAAGVSTLGAGMLSAADGIQAGPDSAGSSQAQQGHQADATKLAFIEVGCPTFSCFQAKVLRAQLMPRALAGLG